MSDAMVSDAVTYHHADGIAKVTIDDGKANALSPGLLAALDEALDRADDDDAVLVLTGRPKVFSAGFDLGVVTGGGQAAVDLVISGFELAARLLSRSRPVIIGSTGHAVAMGLFVVLSGDHRVGVHGPYTYCANEVAIGMTLPESAVSLCRARLTPAAFQRATILSSPFDPESAVDAGVIDAAVPVEEFDAALLAAARAARDLHPGAHRATKSRVRASLLAELRAAIAADRADLVQSLGGG